MSVHFNYCRKLALEKIVGQQTLNPKSLGVWSSRFTGACAGHGRTGGYRPSTPREGLFGVLGPARVEGLVFRVQGFRV